MGSATKMVAGNESPETEAGKGTARKIRVVVADDSGVMRRVLTRIIETDPRMEVVAVARDGAEAIELTSKLRPDVVTMDINMPRVDGLRAIEVIMGRHPTPIVVISGHVPVDGPAGLRALAFGAVHVVEKSSDLAMAADGDREAENIRSKIRAAANVPVIRNANFGMAPARRVMHKAPPPLPLGEPIDGLPIVAIGASTGGTVAFAEMLQCFPADFPGCVLVVQHMPAGYTADWARTLDLTAHITVREARDGDHLRPGSVFIAPGGHHMDVRDVRIRVGLGPRVNHHRPSVDVLFDSLRPVAARVTAVLLSGMGEDGVAGMTRLRELGADTVAQTEATSVVWGMPGAAVKSGCVARQLPPPTAGEYVVARVRELAAQSALAPGRALSGAGPGACSARAVPGGLG